MNNRNIIGALFISSNSRFHIISLSHTGIDDHIYRTIGTLPTQYAPIKLPYDSLCNIITLIECNNREDLFPFKAEPITLNDGKTAPFTVIK